MAVGTYHENTGTPFARAQCAQINATRPVPGSRDSPTSWLRSNADNNQTPRNNDARHTKQQHQREA
ncbi:MAG: hypothetical protein WCB51_13240 [Candidatus Dormiibacterota bacterium]